MDMDLIPFDILNPFTATTTKDNYVLSVINDLRTIQYATT